MRPVANPPNPWLSAHHEWLEPPPAARVEVYEETAGSILSENNSPDVPFRWSVNPYRGCQHACAYCYARPSHEYLGFGAGTDFDTRLIVKTNAAQLLAKRFASRRWTREAVTFSGVTDCYQPLEAVYGLTRACLEACRDHRNPVGVITKAYLIVRDAELLADVQTRFGGRTFISIPFADDETSRAIEPHAPPVSRRFEAMRRLAEAGVPVGVMLAPIIPGLNDRDIPRILERAAAYGARSAGHVALRLAGSVEPVFVERLRAALPLRADRVIARIREMRGGAMSDSRFGARMRGEGAYWESIERFFEVSMKRFGYESATRSRTPAPHSRRASSKPKASQRTGVQLPLFPA
jgi:DNA repair photolyase